MRPRPRQSGVALLLVLVLVASATVLGLSYATSSTVKLISTDNLLRAGRSRYLAESGLEHCVYLLRGDPGALTGSEITLLGPFAADATSDAYYFGSAPVAGQDGCYLLSGRATAGGVTQRVTLTVGVKSNYKTLMDALAPTHYFRLGEPVWDDNAVDSAGDWEGRYKDGASRGWAGAILYDSNTAGHFDGNDERIELKDGDGHDPDLAGDKLTILAWVWPDTHDHVFDRKAHIISKSDGLFSNDYFWMIRTQAVGMETRLRFLLRTQGLTTGLTGIGGNVPLNKWTLAAVTYDGVRMRIYQDGVEVGSCAKAGNIEQDDGVKAWIGGNPSDKHDRPWHGRIDEVAIFDRALSADEIMSLYKARLPEVSRQSYNQ